jgi:hypothetical protein
LAGIPGEGQAKKLIEAAELWVTGGKSKSPPPELAEAAKAFGVILDTPEPEPEFFDIHPEAEKGIRMFQQVCRQWRTSDGQRIGLDYGVVLSLLSLEGDPSPLDVLEDVRVMEDAALAKLAELRA